MPRSSAALIALALVVVAVPSAQALEFEPQAAIVTRVVDGDSLVLRFPDAPEDARIEYRANLIGVDAPGEGEAECAAGMVTAIARRLLQDERVWVEWDSHDPKTPDGRLLVYVHHFDDRDADLNATYIEQGWGWVPRAYPADRKQEFLELEREARSAKRGLLGHAVCTGAVRPGYSGSADIWGSE